MSFLDIFLLKGFQNIRNNVIIKIWRIGMELSELIYNYQECEKKVNELWRSL